MIIIFHLQLGVRAGPNAQVRKLSLDQLSAQIFIYLARTGHTSGNIFLMAF